MDGKLCANIIAKAIDQFGECNVDVNGRWSAAAYRNGNLDIDMYLYNVSIEILLEIEC